MSERTFRLLIVEDNEDDLYLLLRALGQKAPPHVATCCREGDEAMRFLSTSGVLPDLIIADMILPKVDAVELLLELKANPEFAQVPVLVLSTSGDPFRARAAESLGAVVKQKPVHYEPFVELVGEAVTEMLGRVQPKVA